MARKLTAVAPAQWRRLASDFDRLAQRSDDADASSLFREDDQLSLRAGKLFATCLAAGILPEGYEAHPELRQLRERIERDDTERGEPATTINDLLYPDTVLRIGAGPGPKPGDSAGAHNIAVFVWLTLAFGWLPGRYPDAFHEVRPSLVHPAAEWLRVEDQQLRNKLMVSGMRAGSDTGRRLLFACRPVGRGQ